jgi:hypothetical protein
MSSALNYSSYRCEPVSWHCFSYEISCLLIGNVVSFDYHVMSRTMKLTCVGMYRLLCVEHVEKNDKPMLYLVFEYMDTDLKKYMDSHGRGPSGKPLPPKVVQVHVELLITLESVVAIQILVTAIGCTENSRMRLLESSDLNMYPCCVAEFHVSVVHRACALPWPWSYAQVNDFLWLSLLPPW